MADGSCWCDLWNASSAGAPVTYSPSPWYSWEFLRRQSVGGVHTAAASSHAHSASAPSSSPAPCPSHANKEALDAYATAQARYYLAHPVEAQRALVAACLCRVPTDIVDATLPPQLIAPNYARAVDPKMGARPSVASVAYSGRGRPRGRGRAGGRPAAGLRVAHDDVDAASTGPASCSDGSSVEPRGRVDLDASVCGEESGDQARSVPLHAARTSNEAQVVHAATSSSSPAASTSGADAPTELIAPAVCAEAIGGCDARGDAQQALVRLACDTSRSDSQSVAASSCESRGADTMTPTSMGCATPGGDAARAVVMHALTGVPHLATPTPAAAPLETSPLDDVLHGGPGAWYYMRVGADLGAFPGLEAYLRHRHASLRHEGVDLDDFMRMLCRGCHMDRIEMRGITTPGHPLEKEPYAAGGFAKEFIPKGSLLGVYSGALLPNHALAPYLSSLTAARRQKIWTYDYEAPRVAAPIGVHTFHGAQLRNVCGSVNDYHSIADAPSVCKVPVLLAGILPLVLFVASRDVPAGEELLLEYGVAWYNVFCAYHPSARSTFFGLKKEKTEATTLDILLSSGLDLKQRTRSAKRSGNAADMLATAVANLQSRAAVGAATPPTVAPDSAPAAASVEAGEEVADVTTAASSSSTGTGTSTSTSIAPSANCEHAAEPTHALLRAASAAQPRRRVRRCTCKRGGTQAAVPAATSPHLSQRAPAAPAARLPVGKQAAAAAAAPGGARGASAAPLKLGNAHTAPRASAPAVTHPAAAAPTAAAQTAAAQTATRAAAAAAAAPGSMKAGAASVAASCGLDASMRSAADAVPALTASAVLTAEADVKEDEGAVVNLKGTRWAYVDEDAYLSAIQKRSMQVDPTDLAFSMAFTLSSRTRTGRRKLAEVLAPDAVSASTLVDAVPQHRGKQRKPRATHAPTLTTTPASVQPNEPVPVEEAVATPAPLEEEARVAAAAGEKREASDRTSPIDHSLLPPSKRLRALSSLSCPPPPLVAPSVVAAAVVE